MAAKPEKIVADIGKQLAQQSRPSKDFLVKTLRQAESALSELDQLASLKPAIRPLSQSLAKHSLLYHKDKDVKLLVAVCFCEILRILAPEPSFDDKTFKGIFELFVGMFMELGDTQSPYFPRRVKILENVAKLECCRRMLDLDCDDLILKMFNTFFSVVREEHQRSLISAMESVMSLILNEVETSQPLMEVVLRNLINKGEGPAPASSQLAAALLKICAEKMKPAICGFLTSCILDKESVRSKLKECYHEIIYEIFQCTPHMLLALIPNLAQELVTDQVDVRIKSVNLIGKLFMLPKDHDIHEHHYLLFELLKRFSDKSADVRINAVRAVKGCYLVDPFGIDSPKILSALEARLLDFDASVRMEAVAVVCDLARSTLKSFPEVLIARATDRLRDKMTSVRKEALRKLLEVYREYCTKCYEGQMKFNECFEQIPCKILMLSFDKNLKEFRPQNLELLLSGDWFPSSLPIENMTRHWIYLYSLFTPAHVKALNIVLCQKRRFQKEMHGYLTLRRKEKEVDVEKVNMRTKKAFVRMSATFLNAAKAEESFFKLDQWNDSVIFDLLLQLLDEPAHSNAKAIRDKILEKMGDRHPHLEFLEVISLKCSHNIFSAEHVHYILDHVSRNRCRDDPLDKSLNLLSDIIRSFPMLLRGSEHQFKLLMLEDESPVSGRLVQILANAGPFISIKLGEIYTVLERLCLEGTRAQSKTAISALAALAGPSEQNLVTDLCQKLVAALHVGWNVPTVLQSLGCISQHFVLAFQNQENAVSSYIRERIFEEEMAEEGVVLHEISASNVSFSCTMKIYGLKTLVKGALRKEVQGGHQISMLLEILSKVLRTGKFAEMSTACENDKAHSKLAAAKAVLRLSRHWDFQISSQIFQSTIMMAKDASSRVRKAFLDKTHKLLKEHAVSRKFACAFALAASDGVKDLHDASLKYLVEFIKEYGRAAPACPTSGMEGCLTDCPAYTVVFLLHVLAHDAGFPPVNYHNEELFAQFCRPLVFILQVLVNPQYVDGDLDFISRTFLYLKSIFRAIKRAEDAVNPEKTPKLHILADIGISILNVLKQDGIAINLSLAPGLVLLPSSLYKTSMIRQTKDDFGSMGFVLDENFASKLVQCDFSQAQLSMSVKHGRKCLKGYLQDQNVADLQDKNTGKGMPKNHILEACPNGKQQSAIFGSSLATVQLQDNASVIKDLEENGSRNCESLRAKEYPKSIDLELFGTVSDVSTQEVDVSLSVPQKDERKRKSSCGSAGSPEMSKTKFRQCCSSDGSTVSLLQQCDPHSVKVISTGSEKGAGGKQGTEESKRKVLLDRTNSLEVNIQKHIQPKKSRLVPKISPDTTASDVSDLNQDSIAFRTRRRKT